jgi:hypothetical protein
MAALFEATPSPRLAWWRRGVAAWQMAAACLVCALAGFAARGFIEREAVEAPPFERAVRTEVYMIPTPGEPFRRAFDLSNASAVSYAQPLEVIIETTEGPAS